MKKAKRINQTEKSRVIALAGNPNVGKSTLFNALTGLHQHTGNWPGKTVAYTQGVCRQNGINYILTDLPGTYSLLSHSKEEEAARAFLQSRQADAVIVVCDASALERNLNLVLQILEITRQVVVCINLIDEAEKKKIHIHTSLLSRRLGVRVVTTSAKTGQGLEELIEETEATIQSPNEPLLAAKTDGASLCPSPLALNDDAGGNPCALPLPHPTAEEQDAAAEAIVATAEQIAKDTITYEDPDYQIKDRAIDRFLTSPLTGIPVMLLLLAGILWITIVGANYPSQWLFSLFQKTEALLWNAALLLKLPKWLSEMLLCGVFRIVGWILSVMLPPMAIFFPLFTLLEDLGYLPRIAFNLDHTFQRCNACGKQALSMCMGFGCNAAGVVGSRIIDSERERLLAILTNSFVPCNGKFPTLIAVISIFFANRFSGGWMGALLLSEMVLLGIFMTFVTSYLLSRSLLRGRPSSFVLELPPYRKPRIAKILVRSLLDRTLFVLGRALVVAAPAGLLLWIMANLSVGNVTLLARICRFLQPLASLLGIDGVILTGFLFGAPANEIAVPIMMMAYQSAGTLTEASSLTLMQQVFQSNGWTNTTALCTLVFCLFHWPCTTTLISIKKETGSWKWTLLAAALPTLAGSLLCLAICALSQWLL